MISPRVTIFVTTIGGSTFQAAIHAAHQQRRQVLIEVIDHVAPMAAALQQMVERCTTELFIQLDEDMILDASAADRLVKLIDAQPEDVVMAVAPLWDVEVSMPIYGVKIYRHSQVRRVPFVDHPEGDINDRRRWEAAGMQTAKAPREREDCVGEHGTFYTSSEAFERWRRLMRTQRRTGRLAWVERWPDQLRARYEASGSRRDLFAVLGCAIGSTEPLDQDGGQNFTTPNPTLRALEKLYPDLSRGAGAA